MLTEIHLKAATQEFFARHWNTASCGGIESPEWSTPWTLVGSIPNTGKQGCYAFLVGNSVKYIGSGVAKGAGIYKECGLGARTAHYMRWAKEKGRQDGQRVYEMKPQYCDVTALLTIGFPSGYGYLALAVEAFLIAKFKDQGLQNIRSTK